jgi:DNA modification methylase
MRAVKASDLSVTRLATFLHRLIMICCKYLLIERIMKQESLLKDESPKVAVGPVECLGLTFANDEARRAHFTDLLRQKLQDPEFKAIEGFPIGTDEAILELSDPPYYTACPNPWISDFVELWESQKTDLDDEYHREPFAVDVSEGKNDPIYNAHSYHTKVPHKAIMRYILHYTKPGDIVFDGFCGTGMTGVAAQMCANKEQLLSLGFGIDKLGNIFESTESIGEKDKLVSKIGARKCVLNDLSPAASFIGRNYTSPAKPLSVIDDINQALSLVEAECADMYRTKHSHELWGDINFVIWSDVFLCPDCQNELIYWDVAVDQINDAILKEIHCNHCSSLLDKRKLERVWGLKFDNALRKDIEQAKQVPVKINYTYKGKRFTKKPDNHDYELIAKCNELDIPYWYPVFEMQNGYNTKQPLNSHGISHVHHFYTNRCLYSISSMLDKLKDPKSMFVLTAVIRTLTKMFRWAPKGKHTAGTSGTLYIPSITHEYPLFDSIKRRMKIYVPLLEYASRISENVVISNGDMSSTTFDDNSVDYMFIDPPFGANINYSELNVIWESWLKVHTNALPEAIENKVQGKGPFEYKKLMTECFKEAYRILKPSRWLTVEFSNTKASVWNSIQSALSEAGFIVANVSALDKKQNTFKAVTTTTAVKQDLVISAYKPDRAFESSFLESISPTDSVWNFIRNHLGYLSVVKVSDNEILPIPERDPRILYDQVVAYYVRKNTPVPISSQSFQLGLKRDFIERDGMYFLPEQVAEYDKKRALSNRVKQLSIFVDDEASAIEWMRQELKGKPKTYSEIHPLFLNELSGWKKNELSLELSTLLEQNFIKYDGVDEVPSQIHTYLSTNFKDMRGLEKDDPTLKAKAKDRWYVPDPNKADDLENVRLRALLREFETYKTQKKIKLPRAEALRAGFKTAWEIQDFQTILDIAAKIPTDVLQEDEKLLMFYDNALTLTSTEEDEW